MIDKRILSLFLTRGCGATERDLPPSVELSRTSMWRGRGRLVCSESSTSLHDISLIRSGSI